MVFAIVMMNFILQAKKSRLPPKCEGLKFVTYQNSFYFKSETLDFFPSFFHDRKLFDLFLLLYDK
jgi:hypothetical protein